MLKFNTRAKTQDRSFSHEQVFKAKSPLPSGLKTSFLAALFCCFFTFNLSAQCDILCPPSSVYELSLNVTGQAVLTPTAFEPLVSSNFPTCQPGNGGVLEIWEDPAGTIPYPTSLPGPNFDCTDIGVAFTVYVTLNDPGPGVQSPTCQFDVEIVDNVVPIIFPDPANPTTVSTTTTSCASLQTLEATVVDNCLGNLTLTHTLSGATTGTFPGFTATHTYNEGTTTITWSVDDGVNPPFTTTSILNVVDAEDPEFVGALPGDVTLNANGSCEAGHTFTIPDVSDNCGVTNTGVSEYEMIIDFPAGLPVPYNTDLVIDVFANAGMNSATAYPLSTFPEGTTTITLNVVDINGRSTSHSFTVTVDDNTGPSFGAAPTNQTVSPPGCDAAVSINMTSFITDNCSSLGGGTISVSYTVNGGTPQMGANASGTYSAGFYTIVFTATDAEGNSTMHTYTLTVNDFVDPEARCEDITVELDGNGEVTVNAMQFDDTADPSSDNCGIVQYLFRVDAGGGAPFEETKTFDCTDIGTELVRFRVVDANGNQDTEISCNLTIEDNMIPNAVCQNISVDLAAGGAPPTEVYATAGIGPNYINNGSNDNCTAMGDLVIRIRKGTTGAFEPVNSPITFDCSEIGDNVVEIRVRDDEGNTNFCQAIVTVNDVTAPSPTCNPVTIELDENGDGSFLHANGMRRTVGATGLPIAIVDDATTTHTLSVNTDDIITDLDVNLDITHTWVGDLDITLTSPAGTSVKLFDNLCSTDNDMMVTFDDDAGSAVVCASPVSGTYTPDEMLSAFNGENAIGDWTLTIADVTASDDGTLDTWELDFATSYQYEAGLGSTDDCGYVSWSASPADYDCNDLFPITPHIYTLTVTDGTNTSSCTQVVTIVDNIDPTAVCQAATVQLNNAGMATITPATVDGGSFDNCTFTSSVSPNTFDCTDIGPNSVTLTVTDGSGNMHSCMTTVTIEDNVPPVAACVANISVALQSNGEVFVTPALIDAGSADACSGVMLEISVDTDGDGNVDSPWSSVGFNFDCDFVAFNPNVVALQVTDMAATPQSSTCETEVIIQDNEDPIITCPSNLTIDCSADDSPASLGTPTGTDNCAMPPTTLPHSDVISNVVCTGTYRITRTWTIEDEYGNQDMCDQIIEVEDNTAPTFTAPSDIDLECPDSYQVANFECQDLVSSDANLPIDITDNMATTITSVLPVSVPANGKITDVKVHLQASHTRVPDLRATLNFTPVGFISPTVSVVLFDGICGSSDMNVDLMLMDGGGTIPCPPVNQSTYFEPDGSLASFNGQLMNGTWRLVIEDSDPAPNGGGQLLGWGLDICFVPQAMDLTLTGDVTGVDDCGSVTETPVDYMAFKDFDNNLNFPRPSSAYDFSPGQWSASTTPIFGGLLNTTNAPTSISLTSHNYTGVVPAGPYRNNLEITVPEMGWVIFDWDFSSSDNSGSDDPFGYYVDGSFTQLTGSALTQGGRTVVPINAGQIFGFSQRSTDAVGGSATTTITNFVYVDKDLCPLPANACPREFCIARIWNVVDDCGNAAHPQAQIINTDDTTGPSFGAAPTTMTVIADPGICTPDITIDFSSYIDDAGCSAYEDLVITNSALADYGIGDGETDASGFYAPGIYDIDFTATDECGNISFHTLTLEVIDDQDPDAKCVDYTVQLNNAGEATVLLTDVDNGSLDNCPGMLLSFAAPPAAQVSTILLTTANIGQTPVTLYATDASGNMSSCVSVVTVLGGVLIDAEDVSGTTGATVQVPVVTNDEFTDIGSFSVTVEIVDGAVATLGAGGVTVHPDLAALGGTLLFNPASATEVMVSWISNDPFGSTLLPPNTGLFMVEADLVGAAGTSTPVKIEDDVVNRIISGVSTTVPSFGLAGTINVLNTGTDFTIGGDLTEAAICGGDDIHLVEVELNGAPSTPASPIINAAGSYSFDIPQGSTVTVTPTKNVTWFDGSVDIFDVLLVNQHFLGIPPLLDSPYKILAGDINRNGFIDIADVFAINQVSLGNLPAGLGDPWGFVDANHVFVDPFNPWATPVPSNVMLTNVQADDLGVSFFGYHLGDVDCSVDPTQLTSGPVTDGNGGELPFLAIDQYVTAGEIFTVDFKAQDFADYIGYQTSIQFDPQVIEFAEFLPSANLANLTTSNFNQNRASEGLLATNWYNLDGATLNDGEIVFSIKFKAVQQVSSLSNVLSFNDEVIKGKAIKVGGETLDVDLVFDSPTSTNEVEGDGFALYQNTPNPFGFNTQIGFKLPESSKATLTISDASGRVLKVIENTYSAGYHQVNIDRDELSADGVLLYRLETASHTAVRKMILLD